MVETPNRATAYKEARAGRVAERPLRRPEKPTDEREDMRLDFNTPLAAAGAGPSDPWSGQMDELGRKIYVAPSGKKYYVGKTAPAKALPEIAGDVYEAIPPMEDWRMPTGDEVVKGATAASSDSY